MGHHHHHRHLEGHFVGIVGSVGIVDFVVDNLHRRSVDPGPVMGPESRDVLDARLLLVSGPLRLPFGVFRGRWFRAGLW